MNDSASGAATETRLNQLAREICRRVQDSAEKLGIEVHHLPCGAQVLDFGVSAPGGLAAGLELAAICTAGQAQVQLVAGERSVWAGPWVQVATDQPIAACMLAQYAGWPVQVGDFFAMGSGPMRVRRGQEEMLLQLSVANDETCAVGILECDRLPDCQLAEAVARECQVSTSELWLAVAPTRSLAGGVQIVARSVETTMHKLHELGFPLRSVRSGYGMAPLPPPTPDLALGIGRTNDAILYGGHVSLWIDAEDEQIAEVGPRLPSCGSNDFGAPFAEVFKKYNYDFYAVDPGLFSPAEVRLMNVRSGRSWSFGGLQPELVQRSFAGQAD